LADESESIPFKTSELQMKIQRLVGVVIEAKASLANANDYIDELHNVIEEAQERRVVWEV